MPETAIRLDKVTKKYGHVEALKGVSFELQKGDFLTVLGPNGAGKSTLLKILSTQTRPTTGDLVFEGTPVKKLTDDYRSNFGVISHQPFLYENLSAEENLRFYGKIYNVPNLNDRIKQLLEKVELTRRKDDPIRTYSRGMLQRISIARALVHDPDLIFLDEPYTGLDQHASHMLTNILLDQFEHHKTIVLVTHNLSLGYSLASKIGIMSRGNFALFDEKANIAEADFEKTYLDVVAATKGEKAHA